MVATPSRRSIRPFSQVLSSCTSQASCAIGVVQLLKRSRRGCGSSRPRPRGRHSPAPSHGVAKNSRGESGVGSVIPRRRITDDRLLFSLAVRGDRRMWGAGLAAIALLAVIGVLDARMRSTGGPGILGLEFAGTRRRAAEIVGRWGGEGVRAARWANGVDYGFVVAYVLLLTAATRSARCRARAGGRRGLVRLGEVVVWLPLAAGLADAVQNAALFVLLGGHATDVAPTLALVCGAITSLLALVSVAYASTGWVRSRADP